MFASTSPAASPALAWAPASDKSTVTATAEPALQRRASKARAGDGCEGGDRHQAGLRDQNDALQNRQGRREDPSAQDQIEHGHEARERQHDRAGLRVAAKHRSVVGLTLQRVLDVGRTRDQKVARVVGQTRTVRQLPADVFRQLATGMAQAEPVYRATTSWTVVHRQPPLLPRPRVDAARLNRPALPAVARSHRSSGPPVPSIADRGRARCRRRAQWRWQPWRPCPRAAPRVADPGSAR